VRGMRHAQADPPDASLLPQDDIVGVTVLLLTCSYQNQVTSRQPASKRACGAGSVLAQPCVAELRGCGACACGCAGVHPRRLLREQRVCRRAAPRNAAGEAAHRSVRHSFADAAPGMRRTAPLSRALTAACLSCPPRCLLPLPCCPDVGSGRLHRLQEALLPFLSRLRKRCGALRLVRNILADKPRVTRFPAEFDAVEAAPTAGTAPAPQATSDAFAAPAAPGQPAQGGLDAAPPAPAGYGGFGLGEAAMDQEAMEMGA
jgi:hypothetical protein